MSDEVFVIAEAGINHNGDIQTALDLISAAAAAGADAVKFQTFRAQALVTPTLERAEYQARNLGEEGPQAAMLKALEMAYGAYGRLITRAHELGIEFMSTAFDEHDLDFLTDSVGISRIKIPSGEVTNLPLLVHAAQKHLPILLSTGMASVTEIQLALDAIAFGLTHNQVPVSLSDLEGSSLTPEGERLLAKTVILLQCTSEYPTASQDVNLRAMVTMQRDFGVRVGFSDHSLGSHMAVAAAALGASVIEKHLTLNRSMVGPDHPISLEPTEFTEMVQSIRSVCVGMGSGLKEPTEKEKSTAPRVRKVLVAARTLAAGQVITPSDVVSKRAGFGLAPMHYWDLIGTRASRDYSIDEVLEFPL